MTARPLASYSGQWTFLPQTMLPIAATAPPAGEPAGMVLIPGGEYRFKVEGIEIEGRDDVDSLASRCVMSGMDLRTLAQLLGHKTVQMVMRYSHLSQSHELAAVERLCETGLATKIQPVLQPVPAQKGAAVAAA